MTERLAPDLSRSTLPRDPRERRRLFALSVLQVAGMTLALLVLYAVAPVAGRTDTGAILALLGALVVFLLLLAWQIRAIVQAPHPEVRAIQILLLAFVVILIVFSYTYLSLAEQDSGSFSEHLSRVAAFYFSVSTFATVGFGDIAARSDPARLVVTIQMLLDLALIAGAARLVLGAVRMALSSRQPEEGPAA